MLSIFSQITNRDDQFAPIAAAKFGRDFGAGTTLAHGTLVDGSFSLRGR
jgi:hypothetical protein